MQIKPGQIFKNEAKSDYSMWTVNSSIVKEITFCLTVRCQLQQVERNL